ncbi:AraC family transcriptional regulator [Mucilaginibacter sp. ZT4R22]|uniref:AraC family transcriptional regulator n=1 Tax=Mucilaginibacter pankratovii TaxID=2772110 RepID=A0ABR7WWP1_9SPHI|nr:helix-turn-helix domain-containing protein [Mucilaginibacter pankratovii]MBD1366699.1 AraC family transcriptional regulator [Mucilaginibacter pankratovii]
MKDIPVHKIQDRANSGLDIRHFVPGAHSKDVEKLGVHRDDHYIFFVLREGSASLMVDFHEMHFAESSLFYLLPGQVHHPTRYNLGDGWFIAVDTPLIAPDYRMVFEGHLQLQQPFPLSPQQLEEFHTVLSLLENKYQSNEEDPFYLPVIHSLLQSFLGIAASCFCTANSNRQQLSRPAQLAQQFKKILTENMRTIKSPSAYAAQLNVSESYLNEALKKTTGMTVSYWITQEVVLEAKRLLYYSEMNTKEIAHTLGYEDPTYFSRIFKRTANLTPLEFRRHYRK